MSTLVTRVPVWTVRFGRDMAGCRYAAAAEQRRPFRWVSWYQPTPSWRGPLKSSLALAPCSCAAAMNASQAGDLYRGSVTASGPARTWEGLEVRVLSTGRRGGGRGAPIPQRVHS